MDVAVYMFPDEYAMRIDELARRYEASVRKLLRRRETLIRLWGLR